MLTQQHSSEVFPVCSPLVVDVCKSVPQRKFLKSEIHPMGVLCCALGCHTCETNVVQMQYLCKLAHQQVCSQEEVSSISPAWGKTAFFVAHQRGIWKDMPAGESHLSGGIDKMNRSTH